MAHTPANFPIAFRDARSLSATPAPTDIATIDQEVKTCMGCGRKNGPLVAVCPACTEVLPDLPPARVDVDDQFDRRPSEGTDKSELEPDTYIEDPDSLSDAMFKVLPALALIAILWIAYALLTHLF